jgi:hypothetical protein
MSFGGKELKELGLGIVQFLKYSFAGCVFLGVLAVFAGDFVKNTRDKIGDSLSVFATVIIGAGVFAFHRTLIIPIHHWLGIGLHRAFEHLRQERRWKAGRRNSHNPVIWLREEYKVERFLGIRAYSHLRAQERGVIFGDPDTINLFHAQNGFLVMTGTAFLASGVYELLADVKKVPPWLLLLAWVIIWVLSYVPSMTQHANEYLELCKRKESDSQNDPIKKSLKEAGYIP